MGGNLLAYGSAEMILPQPLSNDTYRTLLFVDGGNVYNTKEKGNSGFRYSTGVEVQWRTPIAPLVFSLGKALNNKPGDDTQFFQFTIATSF